MRRSQLVFGILLGLFVVFATMQVMNRAMGGAIPSGAGGTDISLPR